MQASDLFSAIRERNTDRAIAIVRAHPELSKATNEQGMSALMFAAYYQQTALIDEMKKAGLELNLFEAAIVGDREAVERNLGDRERSLDAASPLDQYAADGFTPLGLAAYFGQQELVAWMIEQGADVNKPARNAMQVAPLHSAVARQNVELCRLLLEHGADVNARQARGVTPLHSAAHSGNAALIELLLAHGADPSLAMDNGRRPADLAREAGKTEVLPLLRR